MDRVDDPTNVPAQPAPAATVNPAFFDNGAAGTIITQDWLNGVQEEIASQIESAPYSGTLDKTNDDLLRDSIRFQSGSMLSANIDTGAVTPLYSAAVIASSTSRAQVQNTAARAIQLRLGGILIFVVGIFGHFRIQIDDVIVQVFSDKPPLYQTNPVLPGHYAAALDRIGVELPPGRLSFLLISKRYLDRSFCKIARSGKPRKAPGVCDITGP